MRWRFLDRVLACEPWSAARGYKAVSLEEYSLLEPLGRQGVLPETLHLETAVHLVRWLVLRSSDFQQSCQLAAVTDFAVGRAAGAGCRLEVSVRAVDRNATGLLVHAELGDPAPVGGGTFSVALLPAAALAPAADLRALWQELYDPA